MNDWSVWKTALTFPPSELETRWKAATSIIKYGAKAIEPLLMYMYDDDQNVRILSIWALGRIGDKHAIVPISRFLHDDDDLIRMASKGALSRLNHL